MDEDSIDIESLLNSLDTQGMAGFTQAFFTDFEKGMSAVNNEHLPWLSELQKQSWNGVLCLGMGGSAAGGDFLSTLSNQDGETPFITQRDYTIPSWWNASWLVLATSHSGNTEETLHATEAALKQGATVIVIATGGVLAGLCELYENCFLIPSIGGQPPRTAFGHLATCVYFWSVGNCGGISLLAGAHRSEARQRMTALVTATRSWFR